MISCITGINIEKGIKYTGHSATLYIRFLKHFPADPSIFALKEALDSDNIEDAYRHAHTLKGLTEQLCITALSTPSSTLCELLRQKDPTVISIAKVYLLDMLSVYNEIIAQINLLP